MREQFEKLPEIAERLKVGDVYWNDDAQSYKFTGGTYRRATFINGAFYAFQEQQKKIDSVLHYLSCAINPLDVEVIDIEELLK